MKKKVMCEACGKKIPVARIKAIPDTKHCVNCVDEHGDQLDFIPICTEDNTDVAVVKNADQSVINMLKSPYQMRFD
jgi:hypothetical protein